VESVVQQLLHSTVGMLYVVVQHSMFVDDVIGCIYADILRNSNDNNSLFSRPVNDFSWFKSLP